MIRMIPITALAAVLLIGCADEDEAPNCEHRVCDVREEACVDFIAEVVACQRDVPAIVPAVRFMTSDEFLAERQAEPPTPQELERERDYWAGEALVGLMPPGYDPADAVADSIANFVAFYRFDTDEIVMLTDAIDDEEYAYRVMVHEMIHAYQDAEYDLEALFARYATTFPRSMGVRAAIEGEAVHYTVLADLEREGLSPHDVDWSSYFWDWRNEMLALAQQTQTPSLDVGGLFPYAFGSEQVYYAWAQGELEGVRAYVQQPPDSVRQVMAGYRNRPPMVFNMDAQLDPQAVPVLPGHTYLGGGAQDAWLINAMLNRTGGDHYLSLWSEVAQSFEADHLSVWRDDASGHRVAVWRLRQNPMEVSLLSQSPGTMWQEGRESETTHHVRTEDGDWVLVASERENAVALADAITGWQSRDQAIGAAGLMRRPEPRGLVLPNLLP